MVGVMDSRKIHPTLSFANVNGHTFGQKINEQIFIIRLANQYRINIYLSFVFFEKFNYMTHDEAYFCNVNKEFRQKVHAKRNMNW